VSSLRSGGVVFLLSGFAALAVAATGGLLLWRYQQATLAAAADREAVLVQAHAEAIGGEVHSLVDEVGRLSRLAEVDLADGNLEPEKVVLRAARRDTAVFAVSIAILDAAGEVAWAEPPGVRPSGPGTDLLDLARGQGLPALRYRPGEISVAAPVAGQGAIVAFLSGERDVFGADLRRTLRERGAVSLVQRGARDAELTVFSASAGAPPPAGLRLDGVGQAWVDPPLGVGWLVTEAPVPGTGLALRLVLSAREVEGELAGPFRRLVALVALCVGLVGLGGLALARLAGRLEHAELELARSADLAAMGKTAAAIAHEVKNALNGLSVAVDLLASGKAPPEAARAVHGRARNEVARLRRVADDLTLFAATPRLTLELLDLAALCRDAGAAVAELAEDHDVRVEVDAAAELPVRGDAAKLLGALINLVRNGIEAMGPGGFGEPLGASAPERPRVLELSTRREGARAVVEVADRGPGLATEVRAHLFEPFVTTKRTGTGLGLVIVHRIVTAHGGALAALDRPGGGTVFRLELPAGTAEATAPQAAPAAGRAGA